MDNQDIKTKAAKVWYAIGVLILTFIILTIMFNFKNIISLIIICILLSYVMMPFISFFSNPIDIKIPENLSIGKLKIKLPLIGGKNIKTQKGLSRVTSISLTFILFITTIVLVFTIITPIIKHEIKNLYDNREQYKQIIENEYKNLDKYLDKYIPQSLIKYKEEAKKNLNIENIATYLKNLVESIMPAVTNFMGSVSHLLLIPFATFYILMDYDTYQETLMSLIPKNRKKEVTELLSQIDVMLKQYIKGQLLVCFIIGASITIAMSLLQIPYALIIGTFAGCIDVIPYIGVIVSLIPAVLLALMKSPIHAIITLGILYFIHWLEGHVIIPNIMGQSVKLPPLTIIIALIIGAEVMGIIGMFLAVPIAAILRVVIEFYIKKRIEREEASII